MNGSDNHPQGFGLTELDSPEFDEELILSAMLDDPELNQFSTRKSVDDTDTIIVYRRLLFAAGQQNIVMHFPIEPALKTAPSVDVMVLSESTKLKAKNSEQGDAEQLAATARVKVTDQQPYGIRLEVTLARPTEHAFTVFIETIIQSEMR